MERLRLRYVLVLMVVIMSACKEDHEIQPASYSKMLTGEESKTWEQVSFTYIFNDTEVGEMNANPIYGIPSCALDDQYKFYRKGKLLEAFDSGEQCDPDADDLLFKTSWDIINANAKLYLGGNDYVLSKLTDDSLVFGFRDTLVAPVGNNTFWEYPGIAQWVYKSIK
ncbi:MAG: hypothetical protein HC819_06355 [Cyclobacteriaceae bacterium]|nr:hypothetical protein [Cyclobacteriaceae bacterium]